MIVIRPCTVCGKEYETHESRSKFCSSSCRGKHHRALKKASAAPAVTVETAIEAPAND